VTDNLDRAGIFIAKPLQWRVKRFDSGSIAIAIEWRVERELAEGGTWRDCQGATVWGDAFVVKRDGTANTKTVKQLADSLGWNGSLHSVAASALPPARLCQVSVKSEDYNGKTYHKVAWINPEDYEPDAKGADPDTAADLDKKFGAALREAAGAPQPEVKTAPTEDYGDIPF